MARSKTAKQTELEAFWRAHHDAWMRSTLNQREYCEAHGLPLKRFGNWRARFKHADPHIDGKLLYRRGGQLRHMTDHMTDKDFHGLENICLRALMHRTASVSSALKTSAALLRKQRRRARRSAVWRGDTILSSVSCSDGRPNCPPPERLRHSFPWSWKMVPAKTHPAMSLRHLPLLNAGGLGSRWS